MFFVRSDGAGRARDEGHGRPVRRLWRWWLMMNDGVPGVLFENRRLDLAAKITIDAGVVDEEVAGHVLGEGPLSIRHT